MFKILSYDVVDSTNDFLLKNHEKLRNLTVCWALEQRKGRGRKGRYWHSPKGGLWFSVLFKSKYHVTDPNIYTKIASLSIQLSLERLRIKNSIIKWPNDIYVKGKKLAGVLTESILSSNYRTFVVGIGVNVRNEVPDELKEKAVSMKDLVGDPPDISKVLNLILGKMWKLYNKLGKKTGIAVINKMWKKRLYPKEGQKIIFIHRGVEKTGEVIKVDQNNLIVKTADGIEKLFDIELILRKDQLT